MSLVKNTYMVSPLSIFFSPLNLSEMISICYLRILRKRNLFHTLWDCRHCDVLSFVSLTGQRMYFLIHFQASSVSNKKSQYVLDTNIDKPQKCFNNFNSLTVMHQKLTHSLTQYIHLFLFFVKCNLTCSCALSTE